MPHFYPNYLAISLKVDHIELKILGNLTYHFLLLSELVYFHHYLYTTDQRSIDSKEREYHKSRTQLPIKYEIFVTTKRYKFTFKNEIT